MELWMEMMLQSLQEGSTRIVPTKEVVEFMEMKCYQTLSRIRDIVRDETLTDIECFGKIEEIVSALEEIGSNGGIRHDFG